MFIVAAMAGLEHPDALSFLAANTKRNATDIKITSFPGETQLSLVQKMR